MPTLRSSLGGLIGLGTAGPFSDRIAVRATQRNNNIREVEMRLPALIPYLLLTIVGVVIGWATIGCGAGLSFWLLGMACVTTAPTIAIAYAVDCYRPVSGEIMIVATVIKNTCGFVMSYWVMPIIARRGCLLPTMVEFALTIGPMVLGLPIYLYRKRLRRMTSHSSVHSYAG